MCCWHQLPSGLSRHAGRSRGRSTLRGETTHTYPWLIPIITWCWQFPSLSTNILLIKSKLKLESRAIVVGVAMSPRNSGGKYRCRPTPGGESARASFILEPERVNRTAPEWRHRLHGDNIVDHVVCLKAEFLWHTVLSNENSEFYTYDIYPYLNRSVCLLMGSPTWWRFNFRSSGSSLVFSVMTCHAARTWIFKCEVADVNNGIPIDFRAIKCVSMESGQLCRDNISWYI